MLCNQLVRRHRAIGPASRALHFLMDAPADWLHVKGVFLSAPAKDFDRYHDRSLLPVFADQPAHGRLLAEGRRAVVVADPILIRHRLPQRVSLLSEFPDRGPLLSELVEPILDRLTIDAISAVRIHRAESRALNTDANQLGNQRLPG